MDTMVTILTALLLTCSAVAGTPDTLHPMWSTLDLPPSEQVKGIEACDTTIMIATGADLYRRSPTGLEQIIEGLRHKSVTDVLRSQGTLEVATSTGGIFRSTDDGLTWKPTALPGKALNVERLISVEGKDIAITADDRVFERTSNSGKWRSREVPSWMRPIASIAVDGRRLLLVSDSGVIGSLDRSGSWKNIGRVTCRSLRPLIVVGGAHVIVVADSTMYRWVTTTISEVPVRYALPGDRWGDCSLSGDVAVLSGRGRELLKINVRDGTIEQLPVPGKSDDRLGCVYWNGSTIIAGIDRGTGGLFVMPPGIKEWKRISLQTGKQSDAMVRRFVLTGEVVYACLVRDGLFQLDGTLRRADQRHQGVKGSAIATMQRLGTSIYACSRTMGLFRIDRCGGATTCITNTLPRGEGYAATVLGRSLFVSVGRVGLWRSNDQGKRWAKVTYPDSTLFIDRLDVVGNDLVASARQRSFISTDHGKTWAKFRVQGDTTLLRWTANDPSGISMIGTANGAWIRSSAIDQWSAITTPYTAEINHKFGNGVIFGSSVILGTKGCLVMSVDRGNSWRPISIGNAKFATYLSLIGRTLHVVTDGERLISTTLP